MKFKKKYSFNESDKLLKNNDVVTSGDLTLSYVLKAEMLLVFADNKYGTFAHFFSKYK